MKERILEFLKAENKTSAQFAEEIGVQPSGISHILSGRNNPSLDFIIKMLEKYRYLSMEWLLFGKGSMYKDQAMRSLFDENYANGELNFAGIPDNAAGITDSATVDKRSDIAPLNEAQLSSRLSPTRIVWFYADNSFEEFHPRQ